MDIFMRLFPVFDNDKSYRIQDELAQKLGLSRVFQNYPTVAHLNERLMNFHTRLAYYNHTKMRVEKYIAEYFMKKINGITVNSSSRALVEPYIFKYIMLYGMPKRGEKMDPKRIDKLKLLQSLDMLDQATA